MTKGYFRLAVPTSVRHGRTTYGPYQRARAAERLAKQKVGNTYRRTAGKTKTRIRTMTRKKLNDKVKGGGALTTSLFRCNLGRSFRLPKALKLVTGNQQYVTNSSIRVTHTAGQQNYKQVAAYFDATDLNNIMNQVITVTNEAAGNKTQKTYLQSCQSDLLITNQTNDLINITIYDCMVRHDMASSSSALAPYYTADTGWFQSGTDANGAGNTTLIPKATPFSMPGFTEMYRIDKITHVNLSPGGHHKHTEVIKANKMFSRELENALFPAGAIVAAFRGWTRVCLAVQHGYPINDNATTTVTTASGAADYIVTKTYKYKIFEDNISQLTAQQNLSTAPAQQDLVTQAYNVTSTVQQI